LAFPVLTPLLDGLTALLIEHEVEVLAHLLSILLIFNNLLLGVPEPFIDLLLLQVELSDKFQNLVALWRAALQLFEETPEHITLLFILPLPLILP